MTHGDPLGRPCPTCGAPAGVNCAGQSLEDVLARREAAIARRVDAERLAAGEVVEAP